MNNLLDTGILCELDCGSNYSFIINDSKLFSDTDYKILQGNDTGPYVKCMKLMLNGNVQLFYMTSGLRPFSSILSYLNTDSFAAYIGNIIYSIMKVRNNGFFKLENLDLSFDHIFLDQTTGNIYFLYLPLTKGFYQDDVLAENAFRSALMQLIYKMKQLSSPKTIEIYNNLQNISVSLEFIYESINVRSSQKSTPVQSPARLTLTPLNYSGISTFVIEKSPYIIGRNKQYADGFVGDNLKMIGRKHCQITISSGDFYVEDLMSANGTYLNKVRLQSNHPQKIQNGDILKLATLEFRAFLQ